MTDREHVTEIIDAVEEYIKNDYYNFIDVDCYNKFIFSSNNLEKKLQSAIGNSINIYKEHTIDELKDILDMDAEAIYENDPAATSKEEIKQFYPGYKAIAFYRISHILYKNGRKVIARGISEYAHSITGIDIHPGAKIGKCFSIDHGTGIVIGETTEIGENVKLYQGVTLGAIHLENRLQSGQKRHPTIKDNVVIYANATVLGGDTVIGENSVIGASAFITKSVEPNSIVKMNRCGE